jgi:hypothetical protein
MLLSPKICIPDGAGGGVCGGRDFPWVFLYTDIPDRHREEWTYTERQTRIDPREGGRQAALHVNFPA